MRIKNIEKYFNGEQQQKDEVDFIHKFLHKDGFRQLKTSTPFFISIICICILLNNEEREEIFYFHKNTFKQYS